MILANFVDGGEDYVGLEIHVNVWRIRIDDVVYGDYCDLCGSRIDSLGYCACGAGSD